MIAPVAIFAAAICGPVEQQEPVDESLIADVTATAEPVATVPGAPSTTPAASATPEPTRAAETASFPTPVSDADAMIIGGTIWLDARPATGEVIASIGGVECGRGQSVLLPSNPPSRIPSFAMEVPADVGIPGCGTPGADVEITINGRAVNERLTWQPGFQQPRTLIAGPPFGNYRGSIRTQAPQPAPIVTPYVGSVACGEQIDLIDTDGTWNFQVVVDPEELKPGCGHAGASVVFRAQIGEQSFDVATASWAPVSRTVLPAVDLQALAPAADQ